MKNLKIIFIPQNFIPVSGLRNMHAKLADCDIVIARGGFNTLSECLVLKKPAMLFDEKNNPEVEENLKALSRENNFAILMKKNDWGKNLIRKINKFVIYEAKNSRKFDKFKLLNLMVQNKWLMKLKKELKRR